jgi:hypothetical protein
MAEEVTLNPFNRGDTWTNKLTFTDDNGDPIDITNNVYWMTLKLDPEASDADADAQASVTASGADATNGIVYVIFQPADTDGLLPANYYYDVQQVDNGAVTTIMEGRVKVKRDITRSTS